MRIDIAWSDNAIALLDNIYRFYSKKSQTVYTTNYWILPNLYVFFHKPDLSNLY